MTDETANYVLLWEYETTREPQLHVADYAYAAACGERGGYYKVQFVHGPTSTVSHEWKPSR